MISLGKCFATSFLILLGTVLDAQASDEELAAKLDAAVKALNNAAKTVANHNALSEKLETYVTSDEFIEKLKAHPNFKSLITSAGKAQVEILNLSFNTGLGPEYDKDNGLLGSRRLTFTKLEEKSIMRIGYADNFRVSGGNRACRWEILINGNSCPDDGSSLVFDRHDGNSSNVHASTYLAGYCISLPQGQHTLQVEVSRHPGTPDYSVDSDCHTGWNNSTWVLEAIEIRK